MDATPSAWRCTVCGYVHQGPQPPESCPVCGAATAEFEPHTEAAPAAGPAAGRWRCLNCQFEHVGPTPPESCPVCGVAPDRFEPEPAAESAAAVAGAPRVVILGSGIAGVSAAEAVRDASPGARLTLLSGEDHLPYYRLNLTRYLAGEFAPDGLPIHPEAWYRGREVEFLPGIQADSLDLAGRSVALGGGKRLAFDRLILALGAHPFAPPLPGAQRRGVLTLRTVEDAHRILEHVRRGDACAIVGGGILGLETAGALARRGADVTLLESHGWLMPRQLTRAAGARLKAHLAGLGIRLRENARTRELAGAGAVSGVALDDGSTVPAGLVILATGVRPHTALARKAGLAVSSGVLVDNHLRAGHPDVFAAGDMAEHNGLLYGAWSAAQFQGRIAGLNAAGAAAEFGGLPRAHTLKVLGLDLLSLGVIEPADGSFQVFELDADNRYARFVFRDNRLVGAILLGDASAGLKVKKVLENRADFSRLLAHARSGADILSSIEESLA